MTSWIRFKNSVCMHWTRWVCVIVLLGYGIFIGVNHAPVAAGADSGGYLGSARLLSQGRLLTTLRTVPEFAARNVWMHTPLGYEAKEGSTVLRPTYPIGLPIHYAIGGLVAGWHWGPLLVSVIGALAAVLICFWCARELEISPILSATGAAALAVSPLLLYMSFIPMSDTIATAWCGAAFLASLRARRGRGWAAVCGVAFSIAVLVRPANFILLPVLMLVLWNWRNLWWAGIGAVPGALLNAVYNNFMYGGPFRSGYGPIFEVFERRFFTLSVTNYRETLPYALPLLFVGLLLLPVLPWRKWPREFAACILWAVIFMLFYAFYEFTHQAWWFLRFILPAFPALILLGVAGLDASLNRLPAASRQLWRVVVGLLVVAGSVAGSVHVARERHFMLLKEYQEPYVAVTDWAKQNLPAGALVAVMQMSSSIYYYTDLPILRWDMVDPPDVAKLAAALRQSGRPFYAIVFPFEYEDGRIRNLAGDWRKIAEVKGVTVWQITLQP